MARKTSRTMNRIKRCVKEIHTFRSCQIFLIHTGLPQSKLVHLDQGGVDRAMN